MYSFLVVYQYYSRNPVTQTLKGNKKQVELAENSSYWGKCQWNLDQGEGNLVLVIRVQVIEVLLHSNPSSVTLSPLPSPPIYRPLLSLLSWSPGFEQVVDTNVRWNTGAKLFNHVVYLSKSKEIVHSPLWNRALFLFSPEREDKSLLALTNGSFLEFPIDES